MKEKNEKRKKEGRKGLKNKERKKRYKESHKQSSKQASNERTNERTNQPTNQHTNHPTHPPYPPRAARMGRNAHTVYMGKTYSPNTMYWHMEGDQPVSTGLFPVWKKLTSPGAVISQ